MEVGRGACRGGYGDGVREGLSTHREIHAGIKSLGTLVRGHWVQGTS